MQQADAINFLVLRFSYGLLAGTGFISDSGWWASTSQYFSTLPSGALTAPSPPPPIPGVRVPVTVLITHIVIIAVHAYPPCCYRLNTLKGNTGEWEDVAPLAAPVGTFAGLLAGFSFMVALWPVWSFLTPVLLVRPTPQPHSLLVSTELSLCDRR
jgi:hypothetical protein